MKEEYHQTQFVTELTEGAIPEHFFIVTGHNPFGGRATESENSEINDVLLAQIRNSGWHHFPVTGQCQDHAEAGYGVICTRAEAIMLGEEFRQDAIYEVRDDEVILVACKEGEGKGKEEDQTIGRWSELRAPLL
jgi:hypothetical protein